jgi:hypothetical protein
MKQLLLSASCAVAALSIFAPDLPAQTLGAAGAGTRRHAVGTPEQHAHEIIAKYDKDGDHALDAMELAAFFEALHHRVAERSKPQTSNSTSGAPGASAGQGAQASPQDRAAKAIEKFDKNGDGKLDAAELAAMLSVVRERVAQHRGQGPGHTAPAATPPPGT